MNGISEQSSKIAKNHKITAMMSFRVNRFAKITEFNEIFLNCPLSEKNKETTNVIRQPVMFHQNQKTCGAKIHNVKLHNTPDSSPRFITLAFIPDVNIASKNVAKIGP